MTPKCCNCRHWGLPRDWFEEFCGVDCRPCLHDMVRPKDRREMIASGVLTFNEGGCTDELLTGPHFGCVHFEVKS